ncbi:MAG: hypothetical protein H7Z76_16095 [Methylotenera sp.]|nr:hypothetical protein [Flavobacterium sp.]
MRYTNEERNRLINEYSERTGKDPKEVSLDFTLNYLTEKSGSSGDSYLVENPDYLDENGKFIKMRKKNTHLTPKKKKRK